MEKVSFAGWRIKEGREDEWRHDVPSWYPHHLSSLESWFEARERKRDKKRVKKYRGEIDSSIDFDFEEREQLPPSSYLSLSLCSLVTSISNGGSSDNATPPPPLPGRSLPAAPVFDSIRFQRCCGRVSPRLGCWNFARVEREWWWPATQILGRIFTFEFGGRGKERILRLPDPATRLREEFLVSFSKKDSKISRVKIFRERVG